MKKTSLLFALSILMLFVPAAFAQPELDTTFGSTGKFAIQFGAIGSAQDVAIQPDNKVLIVGGCGSISFGVFPFCLLRFNENGTLDTTLGGIAGNTGYVYTAVPGSNNPRGSYGLAVQSDGKILAVGYGTFSNLPQPVVIRYLSNGSLDPSFGTGGILRVQTTAQATEIVLQPDGKILIAGVSGTGPYRQYVARLLPDGTLDTTFGDNGTVTITVGDHTIKGHSIALQPDGKIVTGGGMLGQTGTFHLAARLNRDGSLDSTFDGDGLKTVPFTSGSSEEQGFLSIAVQSDGRIVGLGHDNMIHRLNADGSPDPTFDGDGSRQALIGNSHSYDLTVTPSGRITVVGHQKIPPFAPPQTYYRTARFLPDGSPDSTYSDDGFLDIDVSDLYHDGANAAALDRQGRLLIVGRSANGTTASPWETSQFSVARLKSAPAQSVGFSGIVTDANGRPVRNAFVTLKSGAATIAEGRTNSFGYFRFLNVQSGQTYTLSTRAKSLVFYDRSVLVDGEITNYLVAGEQLIIF